MLYRALQYSNDSRVPNSDGALTLNLAYDRLREVWRGDE